MVIPATAAVLLAAISGWLAFGEVGLVGRVRAVCGSPARREPALHRVRDLLETVRFAARSSRLESAARTAVLEFCAGLAAELRAGRPPVEALRSAADVVAPDTKRAFGSMIATAERGGDVPGAMRAVASSPGFQGMAWLAACWQVGVESGAGLADSMEGLADALRAEERGRREVAAQLAAPKATARLLAVLPVLGIALATGLGQRPLGFLFGSPIGLGCLVVGVGIDLLGVAWTARLARAADPGSGFG